MYMRTTRSEMRRYMRWLADGLGGSELLGLAVIPRSQCNYRPYCGCSSATRTSSARLGITIETATFDEGESQGYRLDKKGFYMPYVYLSTTEGRTKSEIEAQHKSIDQRGF